MARPRSSPGEERPSGPRRRGRPPKFDRPAQIVALTLPEDVVEGLRRIDNDLAWAIVKLFQKEGHQRKPAEKQPAGAELVKIAGRRSLIVVNRFVFRDLPGVQVVPLADQRAFLALEPGRGMSDLELAVLDRLEDGDVTPAERSALRELRAQLRKWRRDPDVLFHSRAIIVVEHTRRRTRAAEAGDGAGE